MRWIEDWKCGRGINHDVIAAGGAARCNRSLESRSRGEIAAVIKTRKRLFRASSTFYPLESSVSRERDVLLSDSKLSSL
jgi:hypothetical protein